MTELIPRRKAWLAACCALAGALGLMGLLGWILDQPALYQAWPGTPSIKMNTALGILLTAAAVWCAATGPRWRRVAVALASLVLAVGGLTVFEFASGQSLGIDHPGIHLRPDEAAKALAGRMTLTAAASFVLLAAATILRAEDRMPRVRQAIFLVVPLPAVYAMVGFALGAQPTAEWGWFNPIAPHTAVAFVALASAALGTERTGIGVLLSSPYAGGRLARRLLPIGTLLPVAFGLLRRAGQDAGLFALPEGIAVMVALTTMTIGGAILVATSRLDAADRKASAAEVRYRLLAENASDLITTTSSGDGRFAFVSPSSRALLGYAPEELVGTKGSDLIHPEDLEGYRQRRAAMVAAEGSSLFELRMRRKDGSHVWVESRASTFTQEDGATFVLSVARDISERRKAFETVQGLNAELERRVAQRTVDLQAATKEMEAFTYSVSHDLRAPLRAIDGFAAALGEDAAPKLSQEELHFLDRIRLGAQRMGFLIDDLLRLSRLGRAELNRTTVDLSAMAREVAASLREREPGRTVEVEIQDGVQVQADAPLVRQVLQNLLANAWKFTAQRPTAHMRFGRTPEGELFVQDDGIGFDMVYADKLFMPFQRLVADAQFQGNGIGLSIVKRIVERHGGRVRATGRPGAGATFFFSLG